MTVMLNHHDKMRTISMSMLLNSRYFEVIMQDYQNDSDFILMVLYFDCSISNKLFNS